MKKYLYLFCLLISTLMCSQSKYTEAQVEKSNDPQVIANFIKYNPDNPKTPEFKRKLYSIISGGNSAVAKPTIKPLTTKKLEKDIKKDLKDGTNDKNKQTAALLTHLFSNDPNEKEAYIQIENKSKCNLIVKISGKKFYNLTIPANNKNFIMVDKGTYKLTTSVCDAQYSSVKTVNKDIVISLNYHK
ncbi:DUF6759 domain-containing protein [Halpernia frigidisoli]|uniref:DUF6759 domain-containing protein n=1 Tax=Halpernia frigidisoli TaxID=1125876 RepID=A0A1I3HXF3_9FLAO|nr:DUF6759 domain-containing protein [Halpernia frigidisoli]SFI40426.1 hypothetical protein SAMN05443292_2444 [Halpernia frigidisoli]